MRAAGRRLRSARPHAPAATRCHTLTICLPISLDHTILSYLGYIATIKTLVFDVPFILSDLHQIKNLYIYKR